MSKRIKNVEELVYPAVLAGELEIDSEGRVWRLAARRGDRWNKGTTKLIPCERRRAEHDQGEYLMVRVMVNGKRANAQASRLVWRHFKGPIPAGLTVNHKDGKKKRNPPDNLELATYSEQQIHARTVLKVGRLDQSGEKNSMAKLTSAQVAEMRDARAAGEKVQPLANRFGVSIAQVSRICRRLRRATA